MPGSIPGGPTKSLEVIRGFFKLMDICCYILHSKTLNKFYTGVCQDSLIDRINKHNDHFYGNHRYTAIADDWELYLRMDASDYSQARRLERKIKSMKSSKYIENLKNYPELLAKILAETSKSNWLYR